jgi:hypothetical protein
MRMGKKDDWDDDWDDDVVVKKQPPEPGGLTTRKILWGLLGAALIAVVVGSVISRDKFEFEESPPPILGMWTCDDPETPDLWVEFRPQFVVFGTGGTGTQKFRILGIDFERVGDVERYNVYYRNLAGREHNKEFVLTPPGNRIRFADRPAVTWTRYEGR